jgi:hypothetical protein
MQPAAKPMARGRSAEKASTNRKDGTATSACGSAVAVVHSSSRHGLAPRAASTVATARPSGMLCSPIASVTVLPAAQPRSPENDTPTPEPSPTAWAAMTARKRITRRASAPRRSSNESTSYLFGQG